MSRFLNEGIGLNENNPTFRLPVSSSQLGNAPHGVEVTRMVLYHKRERESGKVDRRSAA